MPHDPYKSLYIHIPFCVCRCAYCDFHTSAIPTDSSVIDRYVAYLADSVRSKAEEGELAYVETVYLGGGTPSHIGEARLTTLLDTVTSSIPFGPDTEISMEGNPESLSSSLIHTVRDHGVNRLSIGVQSFDDRILHMLGRAHSSDDAVNAVESAFACFDNVSVDLMCGIPSQTDDEVAQSVRRAISLGVSHVSVYPLTIEPHTPMCNSVVAGTFEEPDEDEQAEQMELCGSILRSAGYQRYEVASYALPDKACKHNIAYWTGKPYLGIGESATTMTQNDMRRMRVTDGQVVDDLDRRQMVVEDMMLGMRMSTGIPGSLLAKAREEIPAVDELLSDLVNFGLARFEGESLVPTERGWLCGNDLYLKIMSLD